MSFSDALDQFLAAKVAAGLSPSTCAWYRRNIEAFCGWLIDQGCNGSAWMAPGVIEQFLAHERQRGLAPGTVSARYRALSAFLGWLCPRHGLGNPLEQVPPPKVPQRVMDYVSLAEYAQVYDAIEGDAWADRRDRVILVLLFWSGLRVSEIASLKPHQVDTDLGLVTVLSGKGGKHRIVPTHPDIAPLMLDYLYARPPWRGPQFLVSNNGAGGIRGPLTVEGVRQMLIRRCEAAGVRYLSPHVWRHGFAMEFLNAGADMSSISAMMGHSSVKVTESVYAHWLTHGLKAEYEAARARLDARAGRG